MSGAHLRRQQVLGVLRLHRMTQSQSEAETKEEKGKSKG